jgi:mono/diheme cytochrome c family protein
MQQKKSRSTGALSWLLVALPIVLFASGLILTLALPQDNGLNSVSTTPIPSGTTAAPQRSDLAPPATRMGLTLATPDYATFVPQALTDNFDLQQFALGRRTYTQWCATCHGDRGQGLALWRSAWNEADQNCTRSGCHGVRHALDGFTMLAVPPALIGPDTLAKFTSALQLYGFIRAAMPFQAPGSLSDTEYWAVTAFLADQHGADAGGQALNEHTAPGVLLHQ